MSLSKVRPQPMVAPFLIVLWCGCAEPDAPDPAGLIAALRLVTASDTLRSIDATTRITATAVDDRGNAVPGVPVAWHSSDEAVITMVGNAATAIANGTAYAVAVVEQVTDSVQIVVAQQVAQITVTNPLGAFAAVGDTGRLTGVALDAAAHPIADAGIQWSSRNPTVVSVDSLGFATAISEGQADVLAQADGVVERVPMTILTPVVFEHATVVPMTSETTLADHTVVVVRDVIMEVGPDGSVAIPSGAEVIDATGMYLMPGLADMHVHNSGGPGDGEIDLFLYVANGVTSVRFMWGSVWILDMQKAVASGALLGPAVHTTGPGIDGPNGSFDGTSATVAEVRGKVQQYAAEGYGFIKVYNTLTPAMYAAIHQEARTAGLSVLGHKPINVSFASLINEGHLTSEHLLGYEQEVAPTRSIWSSDPDLDSVRTLASLAAASGMAETPTTMVFSKIASEVPAYQAAPEARFISPGVIDFSTNSLPAWNVSVAQRTDRLRRHRDIVRVLHEEGVPLLLGTDAGVRWVLPGFSIHEELEEMVAAGLTPYEVYRTGTVNAVRFLGNAAWTGTIEVGKRADLVLLTADPLTDVANFKARAGVMVRGQWFTESELLTRLEAIAAGYGR